MKQKKNDATEAKILEKIEALEKEIADRQILLDGLKSLIEKDSDKTKPEGFVLTATIRNILKKHLNSYISIDEIIREISVDWNGYIADKRNIQITLNGWAKNEEKTKVRKDVARNGFYGMFEN